MIKLQIKALLISALTVIVCPLASAQTLENIVAKVEGEQVSITYDLVDDAPDHKFNIQLYSSDNNYRSPLSLVTGDVGKDVTPGKGKRMVWDAQSELKRYSGNITFEIRATLVSAKVVFSSPKEGIKLKSGSAYTVKWAGGAERPDYKLQLYRNKVIINTLGQTGGDRSFSWVIPEDLSSGGGYELRLVDKQSNMVGYTTFKIGGGLPGLVKIGVPVLLLGAAAILVTGAGGGGEPNPDDGNLPTPPAVPDN